jgi:hypothetical protein
MSNSVSPEQYLDSKVKPIFEPLLKKIVIEKPENPVNKFIINTTDSLYDRLLSEVIRKK